MKMPIQPETLIQTQACRSLPGRLKTLYAEMDRQYAAVADQYGFHCSGCADNCCLTRFHHHTFIEYIFIYMGFQTLEPSTRNTVKKRAGAVNIATEAADRKGETPRMNQDFCPGYSLDRFIVLAGRSGVDVGDLE